MLFTLPLALLTLPLFPNILLCGIRFNMLFNYWLSDLMWLSESLLICIFQPNTINILKMQGNHLSKIINQIKFINVGASTESRKQIFPSGIVY